MSVFFHAYAYRLFTTYTIRAPRAEVKPKAALLRDDINLGLHLEDFLSAHHHRKGAIRNLPRRKSADFFEAVNLFVVEEEEDFASDVVVAVSFSVIA